MNASGVEPTADEIQADADRQAEAPWRFYDLVEWAAYIVGAVAAALAIVAFVTPFIPVGETGTRVEGGKLAITYTDPNTGLEVTGAEVLILEDPRDDAMFHVRFRDFQNPDSRLVVQPYRVGGLDAARRVDPIDSSYVVNVATRSVMLQPGECLVVVVVLDDSDRLWQLSPEGACH